MPSNSGDGAKPREASCKHCKWEDTKNREPMLLHQQYNSNFTCCLSCLNTLLQKSRWISQNGTCIFMNRSSLQSWLSQQNLCCKCVSLTLRDSIDTNVRFTHSLGVNSNLTFTQISNTEQEIYIWPIVSSQRIWILNHQLHTWPLHLSHRFQEKSLVFKVWVLKKQWPFCNTTCSFLLFLQWSGNI